MIQIRAYAIRAKGGTAEPFLYERALGRRDALVRITHCSLARGDIQFMDNDWGDTRFPLVPGHEIVGIVEEVGAEVADLRRGESIYGNYIGSRADTTQMLEFAAEHGIEAIVDVMPFAEVGEAIERVRRRDVRMGLVLESPVGAAAT